MSIKNNPIGVFDSGVGGLSVLRALQAEMPHENFIYVGDTARVPYGNKPPELVRNFSWEVARFLLNQNVKAIIVACNSASCTALPELVESLNIPVFGVIKPAVNKAISGWHNIGIIGTAATIHSKVYQNMLSDAGKKVWAKDCPMFVPLVEEGSWKDEIATIVAEHYLERAPHNLQALILGCTHYGFLKQAINKAVPDLALIDCAEVTSEYVKEELKKLGLLTDNDGKVQYFVSGDVASFCHIAKRLDIPVKGVQKAVFS